MDRVWTSPTALRLADLFGAVVRYVAAAASVVVKAAPGALGALSVAYGLWLAWHPLGFIALGAALLAIDRRVT